MKNSPPDSSAKNGWLWPVGLLLLTLVFLFWRSFLPGYVHFSNDGPLAQQMTHWMHLPDAFTGMWEDLNDIGSNSGSYPLDVNAIIY